MKSAKPGLAFSTYGWPQTRIRRRGMATHQSLRMREVFKQTSIFLAVFFLLALGYVWTRVQVVETGYRLRQLEEIRDKLKEENRALSVEVATLKSPQRLEVIAARMGFKPPTEEQVYFLK